MVWLSMGEGVCAWVGLGGWVVRGGVRAREGGKGEGEGEGGLRG